MRGYPRYDRGYRERQHRGWLDRAEDTVRDWVGAGRDYDAGYRGYGRTRYVPADRYDRSFGFGARGRGRYDEGWRRDARVTRGAAYDFGYRPVGYGRTGMRGARRFDRAALEAEHGFGRASRGGYGPYAEESRFAGTGSSGIGRPGSYYTGYGMGAPRGYGPPW